ncbi:MAG: carboxylesterase family protein [Gammaproteobacteria bacterium]|nr:carboxylesterase family protein [Gammaproteobacteria bacterium]
MVGSLQLIRGTVLVRNEYLSLALASICSAVALFTLASDSIDDAEVESHLVVQTVSGPIQGAYSGVAPEVRAFKGIPFAAPPVGELRWRNPQPVAKWEDVRQTVEFGPRCYQPTLEQGFYATDPEPTSEDYLFLNVWTGTTSSDAKLPVMVWIHGGAFIMGSGSAAWYHGDRLAQDGVVVVTVNYRLGLMGFFAHPALSAESEFGVSGNQGLYDQVAALQWVQDNIAAFGGDPENVTIFGESAGSISVCYLVATPLAKGLFQKAIGQSGGCFAKHATLTESNDELELIPTPSLPDNSGYGVGQAVAAALVSESGDAEAIANMRDMSPENIVARLAEQEINVPWRSIYVDGVMFPSQMRVLMSKGGASHVDTIVGSTKDEGVALWTQVQETTFEDWQSGVHASAPKYAESLIAAYTEDAQKSTKTALQEMMSDAYFTSEMRTWARHVENQGKKAFVYIFNHAPPFDGFGRSLGAFHGGEIQYVFQSHSGENADDGLPILWDDSDRKVASTMRQYWVNFAKTGDPNGEGLPEWPHYMASTNRTLAIEESSHVISDLRKAKLDVFELIMHDGFAEAEPNIE